MSSFPSLVSLISLTAFIPLKKRSESNERIELLNERNE